MILITGANGQIGSALVAYLGQRYGKSQVLATDLRKPTKEIDSPFEILDVTDAKRVYDLVKRYQVTQIYHLAAILSARGETDPLMTWDINTKTYFNILEASRETGVKKIFFPSSIAVFGDHIDQKFTSQHSVLEPSTVYGISKAASENWSKYYHQRYGMDIRSLRYPGIISYQTLPGGGTTDYAVDIYHKAVNNLPFECFLAEDTRLPMIYMDDALRATHELMEAPAEAIRVRTAYNLGSMSFSPREVVAAIKEHYPDFLVHYKPDFRQVIAASWPTVIDDSVAKTDWGWKPVYDLRSMTTIMLQQLQLKYNVLIPKI